ncbi:MAG: glycosyltransferase family 2 protein [Candidatus Coatesbacteria bacterium]|nr:glycosyltransferase family 2 protein [Candidatus Coatesbacteria bacterium]
MTDRKTHPLVSVVMPVFNEAAALETIVSQVAEALRARTFEVLLVDDGSTDASWEAILELSQSVPQVRGLRFTRNFGHQAALMAGIDAALGDAVVMMDSDGEHPPGLIPELIEKWEAGAAVVQGVRAESLQAGFLKRTSSRLFYRVFALLTGITAPPGSADFRLLARPVVELVKHHSGSVIFLRGLIPWLGFETEYVHYKPGKRLGGEVKYGLSRMLSLAASGIGSFTTFPLQLSVWVGASVSLISFLYLLYAIIIKLSTNMVVPGWTSLIALVALLGGVQLVVLGLVGLYVGRIFFAQLNRPLYVVAQKTDSTSAGPSM